MIDKSKRKATAERHGNMIIIRMKGGPDCLWLNMYLDVQEWQMTCDSDIGFFAYHWGTHSSDRNFVDFCAEWLSNEDWLLRKCVNEYKLELAFDAEKSKQELIRRFILDNGEDCDTYNLMEALETADEYDRDSGKWAAVLNTACEQLFVDLPDVWWNCIAEEYTPWQKRFAEICREVIVPELLKLSGNGM